MSSPSVAIDRATVLRASGVYKSFGATRALADAELEVRRGEIHALVGGNGSGKSTLLKILAGVHTADAVVVEIGGACHAGIPRHPVQRPR